MRVPCRTLVVCTALLALVVVLTATRARLEMFVEDPPGSFFDTLVSWLPANISDEGTTAMPAALPPGAKAVRSLGDFKNVDDSLVFPRGAAPEIKNITQDPDGSFRFVLRHRGNPWSKVNPGGTRGAWYDGDRNLEWNEGKRDGKYHDKSRAEVSGALGLSQKYGETWEYATTFKVDNEFAPSKGYCNVMQPIVHVCWLGLTGLKGDIVSASLDYSKAVRGFSPSATARSFTFRRGEWVSVVVRIKIHDSQGSLELSINGDPFQGVRGVKMSNEDAKGEFGCKWGIYGSATTDVNKQPLGDWTVWHRNVWLRTV